MGLWFYGEVSTATLGFTHSKGKGDKPNSHNHRDGIENMVKINESIRRPQFPLGQIVATPGAIAAMTQSGDSPHVLISRHASGDWGDVCEEDKRLNDEAVHNDGRLLSAYRLKDGEKLWIITEADRSATTYLLPDEY